MGWEELDNTQSVSLHNFSAGIWPGYPQHQIPGAIDGSQPIGFNYAANWVWMNNRLEKMFGYENRNTVALNGGALIDSLFFSPGLVDIVGTAGDKIYRNMDGVAPTDITDVVTVTAGGFAQWANWQFGATTYAIGANGVNAPWKVGSAGNASALAGVPVNGYSPESWQNSLWIVAGNTVYFSALGDPENWDPLDNYVFSDTILRVKAFGSMLVVFMAGRIGVLYGTNNRQLTKVDSFVVGIGCLSGGSVVEAKIKDKDVLIFANISGIFAFDGTSSAFKLSACVDFTFFPGRNDTQINVDLQKFTICTATYNQQLGWYIFQFPVKDSGLTYNSGLFILDLNNLISGPSGQVVTPCWFINNDVDFGAIVCCPRPITSLDNEFFVGGSDGFVKRYDPDLATREEVDGAPTGYGSQAFAKVMDLGTEVQFQEVNAQTSSFQPSGIDLIVGLSMNREIDLTFPVGTTTSTTDDARRLYWQNVDVGNYGRWLQLYLEDGPSNTSLSSIEGVDLTFTAFGSDPNVDNTSNN